MPCSPDELRTLFLFESLSQEQLEELCANGHVERVEPGWVIREGEKATCFYVLMDGELVMSRTVGGSEVTVTRTDQRGVYVGAWRSYLGDRATQTYESSVRAVVPSTFFVLDADAFARLTRTWFPMAMHLLEGLFFGMRNTQARVNERERLQALGSLSAGLTHELNNPAAAAVRATSTLRTRVAGMRHKLGMIAAGPYDRATLEVLVHLQEKAVEMAAKASRRDQPLTAMQTADAEDVLIDWFDDHAIGAGWDLAPTFVASGLDTQFLDKVAACVSGETLEGAIRWLNYSLETELLMDEIEDSTTRISTLVTAAKQYSQMDRAPFQVVDVHELLDSTLIMLGRKIGAGPSSEDGPAAPGEAGVTVHKDYDRTLPRVPAYAAELNQVWTNLIDNAIAAMDGHGVLTIRTAREDDQLLVEIGDTGPGVPEDIRSRIFEPFFTTKPVGQGTGLGLDISWRIVVNKHHGDLRVLSEPGDTRFQVRIPLTVPAPTEAVPADALPTPAPSAVTSEA
ncbi:cyclic nucleotide-binding domain-containing protein [Nakamurella flava]|uniref:histidine kinase n=1 Tax=Nakamurella flava TaxID=2576308 RepID=A0A4U6QKQ6_9ACTN|nr:ATP-binding protein [Nakamurella flava]TKV61097.1 cyclic nucleotide-binding domain-containing protein [Nakamurella flava]